MPERKKKSLKFINQSRIRPEVGNAVVKENWSSVYLSANPVSLT